ncbi:hypothetical protein [Rhizobium sp. R693]|uniref:hypothetical protein n=1 Tax=Rhizobium sp. R693 TaxID=1764276 RepID=UPI001FD9D940|nr:hypothetical protein [Rhizobium sp. R693]
MKPTQKSKPDYAVYVVEGEGDKTHWLKAGAGWTHSDGEGIDVYAYGPAAQRASDHPQAES